MRARLVGVALCLGVLGVSILGGGGCCCGSSATRPLGSTDRAPRGDAPKPGGGYVLVHESGGGDECTRAMGLLKKGGIEYDLAATGLVFLVVAPRADAARACRILLRDPITRRGVVPPDDPWVKIVEGMGGETHSPPGLLLVQAGIAYDGSGGSGGSVDGIWVRWSDLARARRILLANDRVRPHVLPEPGTAAMTAGAVRAGRSHRRRRGVP